MNKAMKEERFERDYHSVGVTKETRSGKEVYVVSTRNYNNDVISENIYDTEDIDNLLMEKETEIRSKKRSKETRKEFANALSVFAKGFAISFTYSFLVGKAATALIKLFNKNK